MPTYEYKCRNCDYTFEEFQPMSAESLVECPSCKTPNLYRVIGTGAGMIFKGSGFYVTDNKKDSKCTRTGEKSNGEKSPELVTDGESGKEEKKTDKGACKEETKAASGKEDSGKASKKNKKEVA